MSDSTTPEKLKCFSEVSTECAGKTVTMNEAGFQVFMGEVVAAATFGLTALSQYAGSTMDFDQLRALNSFRCTLISLGMNSWNAIASLYYFTKAAGDVTTVESLLNDWYPMVCTCNAEANQFATYFGGNIVTAAVTSSCSEAAQRLAATAYYAANP